MTADGDGLEILSKGLEIFEANRADGLDNALATHHISLIFYGDHISLCALRNFFFFSQPSVTSVSYIFYSAWGEEWSALLEKV